MKVKRIIALSAFAMIAALAVTIISVSADNVFVDFEAFAPTSVNGQFGWTSTGPYDQSVVTNASAPSSFGTKSLRISNAVTSGSFGDQTFSRSLVEAAGESTAESSTYSAPATKNHFEAKWDFASTLPNVEQAGLSVVASPDRGDGARMSWVQMADTRNGLEVNFYEFKNNNFIPSNVARGLDRTLPHTIKITMDFVEGAGNDFVTVCVDSTTCIAGTSWEDYFRIYQGPYTRTVDSILFRVGGDAAPATQTFGFLIDNLNVSSGPTTGITNASQCKGNGWKTAMRSNGSNFGNQGECVSYINTGK